MRTLDRIIESIEEAREVMLEYDPQMDRTGNIWDAARVRADKHIVEALEMLAVINATVN